MKTPAQGILSTYRRYLWNPFILLSCSKRSTLNQAPFESTLLSMQRYGRYSWSTLCWFFAARGGLLLGTPPFLVQSDCRKMPKCCGEIDFSAQNSSKMGVCEYLLYRRLFLRNRKSRCNPPNSLLPPFMYYKFPIVFAFLF